MKKEKPVIYSVAQILNSKLADIDAVSSNKIPQWHLLGAETRQCVFPQINERIETANTLAETNWLLNLTTSSITFLEEWTAGKVQPSSRTVENLVRFFFLCQSGFLVVKQRRRSDRTLAMQRHLSRRLPVCAVKETWGWGVKKGQGEEGVGNRTQMSRAGEMDGRLDLAR